MILNSPYVSGSLTVTGNEVITGSLTVLGGITGAITGSATSASYAFNASYLNGSGSGEFVPTGSFNTFSSSILSYTASNNTNIGNINATTASLNTFSGSTNSRLSSIESTTGSLNAASGSAITRLSALEVTSGSNITRISALEVASGSTITRLSSLEVTSGSNITRLSSLESKTGSYATTGSNTFVGGQYISQSSNPTGFTTTASLYTDGGLRIGRDAYISGTLYLNNVTVYGTQSVCFITSSQLNIASNIISVNTATPSVRFGGLSVYDSGSTGLTGSILWDSQDNQWIYSNPSGSEYDSAMFLVGPRNTGALGGEAGITCNFLSKGNGMHHMTSSGIFEDGSRTCFYGTTVIGSGGTVCTTMANASCIGIGTQSPSAKLHVAGGNNVGTALLVTGADASEGNVAKFARGNSEKNFYIGATNNQYVNLATEGDFKFKTGVSVDQPYTSGVTSLVMTSTGEACFACQVCAPAFVGGTISGTTGTFSGNVTISTNQNALTRLIISNTTAGTGAYVETSFTSDSSAGAGAVGKFGSSTTPYKITTASNTYLYNSAAGDIAILNDFSSGNIKLAAGGSSTPHLFVCSSGNVGIGTTTPSQKLELTGGNAQFNSANINVVAKDTGTGYAIFVAQSQNGSGGILDVGAHGCTANAIVTGAPANAIILSSRNDNELHIGTNSVSRLRIASTGAACFSCNVNINGSFLTMDGSGVASPPVGLGYGLFPHSGVGLGISSVVGISFWTSATPVERFRIASTGVACFACELTAKSLGTNDLILNNLNHEHANYVDGTRGSWLIQEGACDLFIINQVSCKKYKFNLIEIK